MPYYHENTEFRWHQRLLLTGNGSGRRIASSPDLEVAFVVECSSPFPEAYEGRINAFGPIGEQVRASLLRRARQLAMVIGFGGGTQKKPYAGKWLLSDGADDCFGEEVLGGAQLDPDTFVARGTVGIVKVGERWLSCEYVADGAVQRWRQDEAMRASRDERIIGHIADERGRRFVDERVAMDKFMNERMYDFPLRGPRVTLGFLETLLSGRSLLMHHQNWVLNSGVNANGGASRDHLTITETLRWAVQYDQVDVTMLASTVVLCRKNSSSPQFPGNRPFGV